MSVKQMTMVWELDIDPNEKIVLLAYADHADDEGEHVYPSLGRVAHKTCYSVDQVRRISKKLTEAGLMELVKKGQGRGHPHQYRLTLQKGSRLPAFQSKAKGGTQNAEKVASEAQKGGIAAPPEPSLSETSVQPSSYEEESKASSSADSQSEPPTKEDSQDPKQYAVAQLMERVSAAEQRGASLHRPTNDERKQFSKMFEQCFKDGRGVDILLLALDYQVSKAAGEIEGEPKAWCGYRTALDRVNEGWRPKAKLTLVDNETLERENAELEEWGRDLAKLLQETESANG